MGKRVLVTGGAGYIGSHVARWLVENGYDVTVLDLLRQDGGVGNSWAVPAKARLVEGNCGDRRLLDSLLPSGERFDAILHFAAWILIEESLREPARYYENNVGVSTSLFQYALETKVPAIVFSSTGATYGESQTEFLTEESPQKPISPYGASKLMAERVLIDICRDRLRSPGAFSPRFVALRYFNPAGAHSSLEIGQARGQATHIINVAAEAALGLRASVNIYGTDYPTQDGSCVRDYIHIEDLTSAHASALQYLEKGGSSEILNVGYGRPYSVREVVDTMKRVSQKHGGVDFSVEEQARRPGDPAHLAADPTKIQRVLGWKPRHDSLSEICESHFQWEKKRRERFEP